MLQLGYEVLQAGGLGIKCESSGVGHCDLSWMYLAKRAIAEGVVAHEQDAFRRTACYRAYVAAPSAAIAFTDDLYTCGMHLLGRPDAILTRVDDTAGARVMESFLLYLLRECENRVLASGQTFRTAEGQPLYRLERAECRLYPPDSLLFNPYGFWRLSPAA